MCSSFIYVVAVLTVTFHLGQAKSDPFFRNDYTFMPDLQNFYKIHMVYRTWEDAKFQCETEGASMYYPVDAAESTAINTFWNNTHNTRQWIFIGVQDFLSKGVFETDDGTSINDIYNQWQSGEPYDLIGNEDCVTTSSSGWLQVENCIIKYPFICKKTLASLEWDTKCNMPERNFQYHTALGKCYKFHSQPANWSTAFRVCSGEQAYLTVINTQAEADAVVQIVANEKTNAKTKHLITDRIMLGFHKKIQDEWRTIKDVLLEDSGYYKWAGGQPKGGVDDTCGAMSHNGLLNDIGCDREYSFICEHDIPIFSDSIKERIKDIKNKNGHCKCSK